MQLTAFHQSRRVLKLSAILIFAVSLQVSARTEGQTVTLDLKDAPIQKVLNEASKQTGISIIYNETLFKDFSPVTIKVKQATIQQVLDECLKNQPFAYSLQGNLIVINKKQTPVTTILPMAEPPPMDIHGRVTDSLGNPLAGASVTVRKSNKGTQTDANGYFDLKDVNNNAILVISYTGFGSREYKVNGQNSFSVILSHSTSPLDAIQVIAYGTTTERLSVGNIATVSAAEIEKQPVSNPLLALEGRVPGLSITQNTGVANGAVTIRIQGQNSIASGNDPLVVIDGVPVLATLPR